MTMNFRTIKDSIISVLEAAESGQYNTVGHQRQMKDASEILDNNRRVEVFYSSGSFSKRAGRYTGPAQHDITYRVELSVSKAAEGDLSAITDPASTPSQIATALSNFQHGSSLVDESMDELLDIVYQILMDGNNVYMGLNTEDVANRWIDQMQKDQPIPRGEYVILTASMSLTLRTSEQIGGDSGTIASKTIDTVIDIDGDDVEKTGIIINE